MRSDEPIRVILLFPGLLGGVTDMKELERFLRDFCRFDGKGRIGKLRVRKLVNKPYAQLKHKSYT